MCQCVCQCVHVLCYYLNIELAKIWSKLSIVDGQDVFYNSHTGRYTSNIECDNVCYILLKPYIKETKCAV